MKIKHAKIKRITLKYMVRGHHLLKLFYTKIYSTKYFKHEIFAIYICYIVNYYYAILSLRLGCEIA